MVGDTMFYGKGAGKLATASAVAGDVVECACNPGKSLTADLSAETVSFDGFEKASRRFFVRVGAEVTAEARDAFPVSEEVKVGFYDEFAFVTKEMTEGDFAKAKEKLGSGIINYIRMEDTSAI